MGGPECPVGSAPHATCAGCTVSSRPGICRCPGRLSQGSEFFYLKHPEVEADEKEVGGSGKGLG